MKRTCAHGVTAVVSTAALLSISLAAMGQEEPEEIVVTGSYIRGAPEDAASPVDVISRDDFVAQGAVVASDIIANLNINSGSTTNLDGGQENTGIAGKGNVNLRNLGLNSTLVLINSKRQTVAAARTQRGETFVDINEIPAVMIERIEVLKNGASATYGSDAIAGVVNFITRQDFEGLEFSTQYLRTDSSNQDDLTAGAVYGWSGNDNRTHLVIGADYLERSDLPVLDKNLQDRINNASILGARVTRDLGDPRTRNPAFASLGAADFTDPGCTAAGGFVGSQNDPTRAECRFDSRRYQVYVPETDRFNSMLHLSHEFSESVEVYAEALYSKTDLSLPDSDVVSPIATQFLQLPVGLLGGLSPAVLAGRAPPPLPLNAPILTANGGFNNLNTMDFGIGIYGEPTSISNDSETQRYVLGTKGDFTVAKREVGFDFSFAYSRNESVRRETGINKDRLELALNGLGGPDCVPNGVRNFPLLEDPRVSGMFAPLALLLGAPFDPEYPLNSRGNISLALTSTNQGQGGCMFFNPYLSAINGNGPPNDPALIEYLKLRNVLINDSMTELKVADVVFTADLFELDAGPVAGALGFQWREERRTSGQEAERFGTTLITSVGPGGVTTERPVANDALYGTSTNQFDASQDVKSVFAEVQIPLAKGLEVQLATRYEQIGLDIDFSPQSISTRGSLDNVDSSFGSEVTSKIAVRWQALDEVAVRASFGQSFRVPNLGLLFEGSGYDTAAIIDPLASQAVRNGSRDPSEVMGDPGLTAQSGIGFLRLGLPSPQLEPEKADSYDLGFIFTPIDGLSLTIDYYRVDFRDAITPTPFNDVLQRQVDVFNQAKLNPANYIIDNSTTPCAPGSSANCVVNPAAYFIPGVNNGFAPIERIGPSLAIIRINDINAGRIVTDGFEFEGNYSFGLGGGKMVVASQWNFINQYEVEVGNVKFEAAGHTNDAVPIRSLPDLRGNVSVSWAKGNQVISGVARHIGEYDDDFNMNTISSYTTFDLSYGYRLDWSNSLEPLNLRLGVIDLTDEDIPRRAGIGRGYDTTVFSPNGRRFFAQFTQQF